MTDDNAKPRSLSKEGNAAYKTIMRVLNEHNCLETGGCKTFYSPKEWRARGEPYGRNSELIVVYDGGAVMPFFNGNVAYEGGWTLMEEMNAALKKVGLYAEECTGWYAAIYKI